MARVPVRASAGRGFGGLRRGPPRGHTNGAARPFTAGAVGADGPGMYRPGAAGYTSVRTAM